MKGKGIYLEIPELEEFIRELKIRGISEVRIADIIKAKSDNYGIPYGRVFVELTAFDIEKGQPIIIKYAEYLGTGILAFESDRKKLLEKLNSKIEEITKRLLKEGIIAKRGRYVFGEDA